MFSLCYLLCALATAAEESTEVQRESERRIVEVARRYEFSADEERQTKFELHAKPLLAYSNPIRGDVFGNLFVWTRDARPEVLAAIFDFRSEDKFDTELHVLARPDVHAFRDGRLFLNPRQAGIAFRPLLSERMPDKTATGRTRQMRELARAFSVHRKHPEQGEGEMRLLGQPLYRYASPSAKVLDGALFAFVEATDPEAFLLLEAVEGENPHWRFACARMNLVEFSARFRGEEVWHVDAVSWDEIFDRHVPYAIIREKPNRGLVRTK